MSELNKRKLIVAAVLTLLVSVPYYAIQHLPLFAAHPMKATAIDLWVSFDDRAVFVYLSLYLLLPLPLLLIAKLDQLRQAAFGAGVIAVVSHLGFLFYPTSVPLPRPLSNDTNIVYRLMTGFDQPLNACPSLHASLAVFAVLWCGRLLRGKRWRWLMNGVIWTWAAAILYSTIATRQHVVWDLAAGAALGTVVYFGVELMKNQTVADNELSLAQRRTAQARLELARRLGDELPRLRRFDLKTRLCDLAIFLSLFLMGVGINLAGRSAKLAALHYALMACGIVVTALAINSFVLLMHEGMHHTLFASRRWNRWVSVALGATFLMSYSAYQVMHTRHHDYLGDARDPDDYHNYAKNPALVWALHFVRLTLGPVLYIFLIPALAFKHGSARERRKVAAEFLLLAAIYTSVFSIVPTGTLLFAWLIPLLLVGQMTAIRGFTQHGITDAADPYLASRSIIPSPPVAFLLLNENYHLEHHLFPEVPSYHLRRLHELIWPHLPYVVTGRSYLGFITRFFRATLRMDETPIGLKYLAESKPVNCHNDFVSTQ
ncbi:MAG: fatty acid desaturase [Acidobacteriota bacterium]